MENGISQVLTFSLAGEHYAIPIHKVHEVREYTKITKIPKASQTMKGIIDLREHSVPVIDLRYKMGVQESDITPDTRIIILDILANDTNGEASPLMAGAIADSVHEVIDLDPGRIESTPKFGTKLAAEFILGVTRRDGDFIVILDIDRIFNAEEAGSILNAAKDGSGDQD